MLCSVIVWLLLFFHFSLWLTEVINPWEEKLVYASAGNKAQLWEVSLALKPRSKSYVPQQMANEMRLRHTDWELIAFFSYLVSLSCYFSSSQILAMLSVELLDLLYTNIWNLQFELLKALMWEESPSEEPTLFNVSQLKNNYVFISCILYFLYHLFYQNKCVRVSMWSNLNRKWSHFSCHWWFTDKWCCFSIHDSFNCRFLKINLIILIQRIYTAFWNLCFGKELQNSQ